jgi:hypothetical protein
LETLKTNTEAVQTNNNMMLQVLTKMDTIIDLMKMKKEKEEEDKE